MTDVLKKIGVETFVVLLVAVILVLAYCPGASAVLVAYDGFDYTPGTLVVSGPDGARVGVNGGSGWMDSWIDDPLGGGTNTSFSSVIQADSLTYEDSLGNTLVTVGGKMLNTGVDGTSTPGRFLAERRSTGSTWISYLSQRIGTTAANGTFTGGANVALFDYSGRPLRQERLNIGPENSNNAWLNPDTMAPEDRFQFRYPDVVFGILNSNLPPEKQPPTPNNNATAASANRYRDVFTEVGINVVNLMVLRIDHVEGSGDNVYIWMNPDLSTTPSDAEVSGRYIHDDILLAAANAMPAPIPEPYQEGNGGDGEQAFDFMRLFASNNGPAELLFDEFRVATTFADVVPFIPPQPEGVLGDYNENDVVDAADYTTWRDKLGQAITLPNSDTNDVDGVVTMAEYDFWKGRFGATSGSASLSAGSVPEPGSIVLGLIATVALALPRRRVFSPRIAR